MPRTDVMRTLLGHRQSEGVDSDSELATEGQERPAKLAQSTSDSSCQKRPRQCRGGPPSDSNCGFAGNAWHVLSGAGRRWFRAPDGEAGNPNCNCETKHNVFVDPPPPWNEPEKKTPGLCLFSGGSSSSNMVGRFTMSTVLHAIVAAALFRLAGLSALAPPLGGELE